MKLEVTDTFTDRAYKIMKEKESMLPKPAIAVACRRDLEMLETFGLPSDAVITEGRKLSPERVQGRTLWLGCSVVLPLQVLVAAGKVLQLQKTSIECCPGESMPAFQIAEFVVKEC